MEMEGCGVKVTEGLIHDPNHNHYTGEEVLLANRNHGCPLETLKLQLTPPGLHYLLIHFDIPIIDPNTFELEVDGLVANPGTFSMDDIRNKSELGPLKTVAVTMECAGNSRVRMQPRKWDSMPWKYEAIGTAKWTGISVKKLLEFCRIDRSRCKEILFTGLDKGVQENQVQYYQRSLSLSEIDREEVILAFEMNGTPLLPQHGAPLRLIVPGWYGMTSVKWLGKITAIDYEFKGYQMKSYYYLNKKNQKDSPVDRQKIRSLCVPPGIPDWFTRLRYVEKKSEGVEIIGRAWTGGKELAKVEVSVDNGKTWGQAEIGLQGEEDIGLFAWKGFKFLWRGEAMEVGQKYVIRTRAWDVEGRYQDEEGQQFNDYGMGNTVMQEVEVLVVSKEDLQHENRLKKDWWPESGRPNKSRRLKEVSKY